MEYVTKMGVADTLASNAECSSTSSSTGRLVAAIAVVFEKMKEVPEKGEEKKKTDRPRAVLNDV